MTRLPRLTLGLTVLLMGGFAVTGVAANAHAQTARCLGRRATIVGSNRTERILGTPQQDVIVAKGGADLVRAGGGPDVICGGPGGDALYGSGGNDDIRGVDGSDALFGGNGRDQLVVGLGRDEFVVGGPGNDRLVGNDTLTLASYRGASGAVNVDLFSGVTSGADGTDTLLDIAAVQGSPFDDSITGDSSTNYLFGGKGNDAIASGSNSGSFEEVGATGPNQFFEFDFVVGEGGDDTITGGSGLEVADYTMSDSPVDVNLTTGVATGDGNDILSGINVVIGSFFDDVLTGNDEDNGFEGGGGADEIEGKNGNDVAIFFAAQPGVDLNLAEGSATAQYLRASRHAVEIDESTDALTSIDDGWGSEGDDSMVGDQFENRFFGFAGNDSFQGDAGDDILSGARGADDADGGDGNDACEAEQEINCEAEPSAAARALGAYAGMASTMRSTQFPSEYAWSEKRNSGASSSFGARATGMAEAMTPHVLRWWTIATGS